MRPLRSRMQIVFQDPFASLNPRMSIRQIIEEGLIVNEIGASNARAARPRAAGAARCRPARHHPVALPARVLRRPAPAHRHRPRHRARAGVHPARRADLGARPFGAGADHRSAAQAAGRDGASATCSSRTTSRSCAPSATASWSCSTARSSNRARSPKCSTNPKTAYTERLVRPPSKSPPDACHGGLVHGSQPQDHVHRRRLDRVHEEHRRRRPAAAGAGRRDASR